MSVAFRRESDEEHLEPKFERPLPPGPNLVTTRGMAQIVSCIDDLEKAVAIGGGEREMAELQRDLRYWRARLASARPTPSAAGDEAGFGSRICYRLAGADHVVDIVGQDEADPANGRLAYSSPLARALIGAGAGDRMDFAGRNDAIEVVRGQPDSRLSGRNEPGGLPFCRGAGDRNMPSPEAAAPALPPLPSPERMQALLFDAAREGRVDVVEALVAYGADVAARDEKGHTALILAAYRGHLDTVDRLLALGADPGAGDGARGNTALMGVAFKGHDSVAARLLAVGVAVDQRNDAGQTALMMAAMFGREAQIAMLLERGADPLARDAAGNSAVSLAAGQGNSALAEGLAAAARQPA